jgi:hypothetical protein
MDFAQWFDECKKATFSDPSIGNPTDKKGSTRKKGQDWME